MRRIHRFLSRNRTLLHQGLLLATGIAAAHGLDQAIARALAETAVPEPVQPVFLLPPPSISAEREDGVLLLPNRRGAGLESALTQISIGTVSDEEQYTVELLNRARLNPQAEAARLRDETDPLVLAAYNFFSLDRNLMVSQFAAFPPVPPLALVPQLQVSSKRHSTDMLTTGFQGHNGTDGSTIGVRVGDAGLDWCVAGENIYSFAQSVYQAHASFEADWGSGPGGMQSPAGHRQTIHAAKYQLVGVSILHGINTNKTDGTVVGPIVITEDFAGPCTSQGFVTGVAYYDLNGNHFYDVGEGIGGVQVTSADAGVFAITPVSGGYTLPVPDSGTFRVTFSVSGMNDTLRSVTITNLQNAKVDFPLTYAPPAIDGPANIALGHGTTFLFPVVPGAQGYFLSSAALVQTNLTDGAELGLGQFQAITTAGYSVIATDVRALGTSSFHLVQPQPGAGVPPVAQILNLSTPFRATADSKLDFRSRLGWAASTQVGRAQISADRGATWSDIWTQAGTGTSGDLSFTARSFTLASFVGQELRLRFVYDYIGGSFSPQTDKGVGLYLDEIAVSNVELLQSATDVDIGNSTQFKFTPPAAGAYQLSIQPRLPSRVLPPGPTKKVLAATVANPAQTKLASATVNGSTLQVSATVVSGGPSNYRFATSVAPNGPWTIDTSATVQDLGGSQLKVTTPLTGAKRFYRLLAE